MKHEIYIGDSRDVLPTLHEKYAESVSLVVTSPPYFVGRGYEKYLDDWYAYWDMLGDVIELCDPLLKPGGKFAINFADKYANFKLMGRSCELPYLPEFQHMMLAIQYDLWARIIWDKVRVMIDGARHTTNPGRFKGEMRVAPNWEYIFVWRKPGPRQNKEVIMTREEWKEYADSIWTFSSVRKNPTVGDTKLAIFPVDLPARLIKMYCQEGDIVLDPFVGIGTTVKAARNLGCKGIGIDMNPDMVPQILQELQPELFNNDEVMIYGKELCSDDIS